MVKPTLRTKTISTKVSDEEYERLVSAVAGQSVSEWMRETLLRALEDGGARPATGPAGPATPAEEAILAEVLAARSLMLTLLFKVANGQGLTEEEMRQLIADADAKKGKKAQVRLSR